MIETTVEPVTTETAEAVEPVQKPYVFRALGAPDIFLMTKIIKKIGLKEFKACFSDGGIKSMIQNALLSTKEADKEADKEAAYMEAGVGVVLELADVILGNLHLCEQDIYRLLSQTSNLSVDEIKAPGNAVMFVEMLFDFLKKEEFKDFFKVASTLF